MAKQHYLIAIFLLSSMTWLRYLIFNLFNKNEPSLERVALVYAGRSFHEEVTASISCMLKELGYNVVVYIDSGFSVGGYILPLTQRRLQSSKALYGQCVSKFITINSDPNIISNPEVLMFITYPMKRDGHYIEQSAYKLLDKLREQPLNRTELMLIVHHTDNFWKPYSDDISTYFPLSKTTFLCLSEHTYKSAKLNLANRPQHSRTIVPDSSYKLKYLYPVFAIDKTYGTQSVLAYTQQLNPSSSRNKSVNFVIQGNFGGKHSKRRDLAGAVHCLTALILRKEMNKTTHHLRTGLTTTIQLNLVGEVHGELNIPQQQYRMFPRLQVRTLPNLAAIDFYSAIARAHFLVTAPGNPLYTTTQATSSIPAALITGVPLVLGADLLALYPCLRDAPMHRLVNSGTECEAIQRAYEISEMQFAAARVEVAHCARQLWEEGLAALQGYREVM